MGMTGCKVGWEKHKHKKVTRIDRGFLGAQGHTQEGGGGEQEEDTLKDGLTLMGEGDSVLLPSKTLNESSINDNIAPMPTQNPWAWAWVWAPNVGLWYIVTRNECISELHFLS